MPCRSLCELICCLTDGVAGSDRLVSQQADGEERLEASYELGRRLEGTEAVVREATCRSTGQRVLVKLVERAGSAESRELAVLQRIGHHRHVSGLVQCFELQRHWGLVLEALAGGEVLEVLAARGPYSERDAAHVVRQVTSALEHLHQLGVSHRDLKPESLQYESAREGAPLKLCDFSRALVGQQGASDRAAATDGGTPGFMAPEVLRGDSHGTPVDAWNLGVIAYVLLGGRHPFDVDGRGSDAAVAARVLRCEWRFGGEPCLADAWGRASPAARHAVSLLLELRPERRLTAAQLLQGTWMHEVRRGVATPLPHSARQLAAYNRGRRLAKQAGRVARQVALNCSLSPASVPHARSHTPTGEAVAASS